MKLHMHELEDNLKSQISNVSAEVKDGDYAKAAQVQEKELTALGNEARNIQRYIPKIEKLEQDLELLEKTETDEDGKPTKPAPKDEELMAIVPAINKLVQKAKKDLKTKQAEQKVKEADEKKKIEDAEYAYTPKQGFNWDDVSAAIDI